MPVRIPRSGIFAIGEYPASPRKSFRTRFCFILRKLHFRSSRALQGSERCWFAYRLAVSSPQANTQLPHVSPLGLVFVLLRGRSTFGAVARFTEASDAGSHTAERYLRRRRIPSFPESPRVHKDSFLFYFRSFQSFSILANINRIFLYILFRFRIDIHSLWCYNT